MHSDEFQPGITWLNMSGDVTVTWTKENEQHIKELVERKMKEGYSFFVLKPRMLSIMGNKKVKLEDPQMLDGAVGVVVPDKVLESFVDRLGDADVGQAVHGGKAVLAKAPKGDHETVKRATCAQEVVRSQSVAVRPIVAG